MSSAPSAPVVRLVSCGDELLCGQTIDTNANWLAGRIADAGWRLAGVRTVGDIDEDIAHAVDDACRRADAVILTGGLGPTEDDRTRHAVAHALGTELYEDADLLRQVSAWFARFGRAMNPVNRLQACIPQGAAPLDNPAGTAPGFRADLHGATLFVLPGVPSEMKAMFDRHIAGELERHPDRTRARVRRLHLHGIGESDLGARIKDLMGPGANPSVGTAVAESLITVRIFARAATETEADRLVADTEREIRERLPGHVFGVDGQTLPQAVVCELKRLCRTVTMAESCTGGLLAATLLDVAGASAVFHESVVTYANASKIARLGVPEETLAREGAVSQAVALAMAEGQRKRAGADYALAVTGVAGPDGGTPEKPVGLAWIGLADADGARTISYHAHSDRAGNRRRVVNCALDWLRRHLAGLPPPWQ